MTTSDREAKKFSDDDDDYLNICAAKKQKVQKPIVMLQSSDGVTFKGDILAKCSSTIQDMLENCATERMEKVVVPLSNINSDILRRLKIYCEYHKDDPDSAGENKEERINDIYSPWNANFLNVDRDTLFGLISAANFLDIKGLLQITCKRVAKILGKMSPEEIREAFNIENDLIADRKEQEMSAEEMDTSDHEAKHDLKVEAGNSTKVLAEVQSKKFGLYDFPNEILFQIMVNIEDFSLWKNGFFIMAKVCKRFRNIAKKVFEKYCIVCPYWVSTDSSRNSEEEFFTIFGENMKSIEIEVFGEEETASDNWLFILIKTHCKSLERLKITGFVQYKLSRFDLTPLMASMPKLRSLTIFDSELINTNWTQYTYPELVYYCHEVHFEEVTFNTQEIVDFIENNNQLETLRLTLRDAFELDFLHKVNGKLPRLKELRLQRWYVAEPIQMQIQVKMENLESLEMWTDQYTYVNILDAMTECKNLTKITMKCDNWIDDIADALREYPQLKSIEVNAPGSQLEFMNRIIEEHQNLTEIQFDGIADDIRIDDILHTIVISTKLSRLTIGMTKMPALNYSFVCEMAETTQHNSQLRIELVEWHKSFVHSYKPKVNSYKGVVRRGNTILYWTGYEPMRSLTSTGLLDLNDKCIGKLMSFLNVNDITALFNTCKHTQNAVKKHLVENIEREWKDEWIMPSKLEENFFDCVGKHIRSANLSGITEHIDRNNVAKLWKDINRNFTRLTELTVDNIDAYRLNGFDYPWPNLTKIKLSSCNGIGYKNLCMFDCPNLQHLEIDQFALDTRTRNELKHDDRFRQLTELHFGTYNACVEKFLMELNGSICKQMKWLTITRYGTIYLNELKPNAPNLLEIAKRFNETIKNKLIDDCIQLLREA